MRFTTGEIPALPPTRIEPGIRRENPFSAKLEVLSSNAGKANVHSSRYAAPGRQA